MVKLAYVDKGCVRVVLTASGEDYYEQQFLFE